MVTDISIWDKINLQKYIYLISVYLKDEITSDDFVEFFLHLRREDSYWMSSSFDNRINFIMDTIFMDIDEYTPEELLDSENEYYIDERELRVRLQKQLDCLNEFI